MQWMKKCLYQVRRFIDMADVSTKTEIERLIAGEGIEKGVAPELTCDEIYKSIENLWSVLFTTGYLTHNGRTESGNREADSRGEY